MDIEKIPKGVNIPINTKEKVSLYQTIVKLAKRDQRSIRREIIYLLKKAIQYEPQL